MIKTLSIKEVTLGNLPSVLITNKIPNFSNLPTFAGRIPSINQTPFKLTGNIPTKEYQVQARS